MDKNDSIEETVSETFTDLNDFEFKEVLGNDSAHKVGLNDYSIDWYIYLGHICCIDTSKWQ